MAPSQFVTAATSLLLLVSSTPTFSLTCSTPVSAKSGRQTLALVELYTSEGCNSCPPADKWLSQLSYMRDGVVPLAFHVDYWDYIGWKDRFGKPEFALRQREAVVRQGGRTAYTPQVIVDGRDQLGWQYQTSFRSQLQTVAARTPRADLSVNAAASNTSVEASVNIAIPLSEDRKDTQLFLAVTESNLTSTIIAGENKGLKHRHDHVVRELVGPFAIRSMEASNGSYSVRRVIPIAGDWKRNDLALVAFVQDARTGEALQALRLPVCKE